MPTTTKKVTVRAGKVPATPGEIWAILREVSKGQRETDRQLNDLRESQGETGHQMKETDRRMKETDRIVREGSKKMKELQKLFEDQWGKLMEALVKGDLLRLLNEKNIEVQGIAREHSRKRDGREYEFDIIAVNGDSVVVVEVKTTLRLKDVENFIKKLKVFREIFAEYADKKIHGAVAYLKANHGTDKKSEQEGLFVIRAVGNGASITNRKGFRAKEF